MSDILKTVFDKVAKKSSENKYDGEEQNELLSSELRGLGWKFSGSGDYSDVYSHAHKDFIIKINRMQDNGFKYFEKLTKEFPNPHFPKFYEIKKMYGASIYLYKIEKLEPLHSEDGFLFFEILFSVRHATNAKTLRTGLRMLENEGKTIEELSHGCLTDRDISDFYKYLDHEPALEKAVDILLTHKRESLDISFANIMERKDGTIVITDPYSWI